MSKKKIAAVLAALLAVLGAVQQLIANMPDDAAPRAPATVQADAGVAQ
jgi:hypothetical protein